MLAAQADLEKAVAEGRAKEAKRRRNSLPTALPTGRDDERLTLPKLLQLNHCSKEADRATRAERERQAARDAVDHEAGARDEAGITEHRHALV